MQKNYQSDFDAILTLLDCSGRDVGFPPCDWTAYLKSENGGRPYVFSYIGGIAKNCFNDNGRIHVVCKDHGLPPGELKVVLETLLPDVIFPDGKRREVKPMPIDLELVTGPGDCGSTAEIELLLPYLKGEAFTFDDFTPEQIKLLKQPATDAAADLKAFAEQVNTAETSRADAETARLQAEELRVNAERERANMETIRQLMENKRVAAENERAEAEADRAAFAEQVNTAETSRAEAETTRRQAEELRVNAERERANMETTRQLMENKRVAAENERAEAEFARAEAEELRVNAERERANMETVRQLMENKRVAAENERAEAELARAAAEIDRQAFAEQFTIHGYLLAPDDGRPLSHDAYSITELLPINHGVDIDWTGYVHANTAAITLYTAAGRMIARYTSTDGPTTELHIAAADIPASAAFFRASCLTHLLPTATLRHNATREALCGATAGAIQASRQILFDDLFAAAVGSYGRIDHTHVRPDDTPAPYYLNGLWLTYTEAIASFIAFHRSNYLNESLALARCRTNIPFHAQWDADLTRYAQGNTTVEVLNLPMALFASKLFQAFYGCTALREVYGIVLHYGGGTVNNLNATFTGCRALERLEIKGLGGNIDLSACPAITLQSFSFIIYNAKDVGLTILVHPDPFAKFATSDIDPGDTPVFYYGGKVQQTEEWWHFRDGNDSTFTVNDPTKKIGDIVEMGHITTDTHRPVAYYGRIKSIDGNICTTECLCLKFDSWHGLMLYAISPAKNISIATI